MAVGRLVIVAGFSIIELMVVIAIIAVMAVVAVVRYGDYMIAARLAQFESIAYDVLDKGISQTSLYGDHFPTPEQLGLGTGGDPVALSPSLFPTGVLGPQLFSGCMNGSSMECDYQGQLTYGIIPSAIGYEGTEVFVNCFSWFKGVTFGKGCAYELRDANGEIDGKKFGSMVNIYDNDGNYSQGYLDLVNKVNSSEHS